MGSFLPSLVAELNEAAQHLKTLIRKGDNRVDHVATNVLLHIKQDGSFEVEAVKEKIPGLRLCVAKKAAKTDSILRAKLFTTKTQYLNKDIKNIIGVSQTAWQLYDLQALEKQFSSLAIYRNFLANVDWLKLKEALKGAKKEALKGAKDEIAFTTSSDQDIQSPFFEDALISHIAVNPTGISNCPNLPYFSTINLVSCDTDGSRTLYRYGIGKERQHGVTQEEKTKAYSVLRYLGETQGQFQKLLHVRTGDGNKLIVYSKKGTQKIAEDVSMSLCERMVDESYQEHAEDRLRSMFLKRTHHQGKFRILEMPPITNKRGRLSYAGDETNETYNVAVDRWNASLQHLLFYYNGEIALSREVLPPLFLWSKLYPGKSSSQIIDVFFGHSPGDVLANHIWLDMEHEIFNTVKGVCFSEDSLRRAKLGLASIVILKGLDMDMVAPQSLPGKLGRLVRSCGDLQKQYHKVVHRKTIKQVHASALLERIATRSDDY
jgi:hypothetical protein